MHHMDLVEGQGNEFVGGRAREGDAINRVYVVDSDELPFHQAEVRLCSNLMVITLVSCLSQARSWAEVLCCSERAVNCLGLLLYQGIMGCCYTKETWHALQPPECAICACRCTTSSMMALGTPSQRSTSAIRRRRCCALAGSPLLGAQRVELDLGGGQSVSGVWVCISAP